jgi:hypothetical protein
MTLTAFQEDALNALRAKGIRLDANETAIFLQKLEHVKTEIVETDYNERKSKTLLPMATVERGAETYVWYRMNRAGIAKMIAAYATDLPNVSEYGMKVVTPIEDAGVSYSYSVSDLEKAAKAGYPLTTRQGNIAREAMEALIDIVLAHGYPKAGIPGFLTATGVPLVTAGLNGDWNGAATAQEMFADLMTMAFQVWTQTKQKHGGGGMTLLLGTECYKAIYSKPYSVDNGNGTSVAAVFLASQKMITSIEPWTELDLADAQGDGERAVVYSKDSKNLEAIVAIEWETLPPQAVDLGFKVPCRARIGGTVVTRPMAQAYFDGLND